MAASNANESAPAQRRTTVQRTSDTELLVTRTFDAPARLVFAAWTTPEIFQRWWAPKSMGMSLRSVQMDVRVGGSYRLVFNGEPEGMAFYGTYLEVVPASRLVWTNEESGENGPVTTLTLEERDGQTYLELRERYPSKEALDAAGTGAAEMLGEMFGQLDGVLGEL